MPMRGDTEQGATGSLVGKFEPNVRETTTLDHNNPRLSTPTGTTDMDDIPGQETSSVFILPKEPDKSRG